MKIVQCDFTTSDATYLSWKPPLPQLDYILNFLGASSFPWHLHKPMSTKLISCLLLTDWLVSAYRSYQIYTMSNPEQTNCNVGAVALYQERILNFSWEHGLMGKLKSLAELWHFISQVPSLLAKPPRTQPSLTLIN